MLGTVKTVILTIVICVWAFTYGSAWAVNPTYFTQQSTTVYGLQVNSTTLSRDNQTIGLLRSVKLPLLPWYVLFDFYINKDHRQKGYGKKLFKHVLHEAILKKATKIFLNPGPFEEKDGKFIPVCGPERAKLLQKLIKFYQSFNFRFMNNRYLATMLKACYKVAGIQEDPHLLMVYNKENHHAK